jgi:lysophospholipase L1-like esterase
MHAALRLSFLAVACTTVACLGAGDPTLPAPRTEEFPWMSVARWTAMHEEDVAIAKRGGVDLLFIGDSITEGWEWGEGAVWKEHFAPRHAANFGIGGDLTQNVLWRLQNGATGALKPKVVVLLIGTNNIGREGDEPGEIARGIKAVVAQLRTSFPAARILVLGIFPCGERGDDPKRASIARVNAAIAGLHDGRTVFVQDIGKIFLEPDGSISKDVMPDSLHLSEEGYRRWAAAILPTVKTWLE